MNINPKTPLTVGALFLKGKKTPLTNVNVFVMDRFIIVSRNDKEPPTWYNIDEVTKMCNVEGKKKKPISNIAFKSNGESYKITKIEEIMNGNYNS